MTHLLDIRNYSISKKLTCMNMLVSAAALLLACGGFCAYDLYSFRDALVRNVSIQAQIIGDNTTSALLFDDSHSAEKTLSALNANRHLMYAQIYTHDGQPFAAYWRERSKAGDTLHARIVNTSSGAGLMGSVGQGNYQRGQKYDDDDYRIALQPVVHRSQVGTDEYNFRWFALEDD